MTRGSVATVPFPCLYHVDVPYSSLPGLLHDLLLHKVVWLKTFEICWPRDSLVP